MRHLSKLLELLLFVFPQYYRAWAVQSIFALPKSCLTYQIHNRNVVLSIYYLLNLVQKRSWGNSWNIVQFSGCSMKRKKFPKQLLIHIIKYYQYYPNEQLFKHIRLDLATKWGTGHSAVGRGQGRHLTVISGEDSSFCHQRQRRDKLQNEEKVLGTSLITHAMAHTHTTPLLL